MDDHKFDFRSLVATIVVFSAILAFSLVAAIVNAPKPERLGKHKANFSLGDVVRKPGGEQGVVVGRTWVKVDDGYWRYEVRYSVDCEPEKIGEFEIVP